MGSVTEKAKLAGGRNKGGRPPLFDGTPMKLYSMKQPEALIKRLDRYLKKHPRENRSKIIREQLTRFLDEQDEVGGDE